MQSLTNVEGRTAIDTVTLLRASRHIVGVHKRIAHVSKSIIHGLKVFESVDVSTWSGGSGCCRRESSIAQKGLVGIC